MIHSFIIRGLVPKLVLESMAPFYLSRSLLVGLVERMSLRVTFATVKTALFSGSETPSNVVTIQGTRERPEVERGGGSAKELECPIARLRLTYVGLLQRRAWMHMPPAVSRCSLAQRLHAGFAAGG